ncbi:hypothetical protein LG201_06100 [Methylobacillus gramineus]|uniref:hypothetical protein n=1 Tax=Methylobacillus gramineus TaxID=755169 RepID=UPI001CFF6980|nr:hypothetical protein [Methylobacillus gramineus]MCB5184772.1 hypothetical protein [Methylobacillus gramineus]
MAAVWLTVLKNVPWTEVIRKAPAIAEGARRLWEAVARKPKFNEFPINDVPYTELETIDAKDARIEVLENRVAELHVQMLNSSELLKTLADQNEQLVARVEANRLRTARLTRVVVVLVIAMLASLLWLHRA